MTTTGNYRNIKTMSIQPLQLSPNVERTREKLINRTSVHAVDIVQSILAQHYEYSAKMPRPTLTPTSQSAQPPVDEWPAEVRSLFDISLADPCPLNAANVCKIEQSAYEQ